MRTKGELAEREKQREFYRPMIRQIFLALRKLCLEIYIELDNFDRRVQRHTLKRDFKTLSLDMFESFVKVEVMSKSERASKAETAFKLFDKNRDGFITREEFTQVCACLRNERCPGRWVRSVI